MNMSELRTEIRMLLNDVIRATQGCGCCAPSPQEEKKAKEEATDGFVELMYKLVGESAEEKFNERCTPCVKR